MHDYVRIDRLEAFSVLIGGSTLLGVDLFLEWPQLTVHIHQVTSPIKLPTEFIRFETESCTQRMIPVLKELVYCFPIVTKLMRFFRMLNLCACLQSKLLL